MATGVRVQAKGQVTIPARIRRRLNLQPGDLVLFIETPEGVLLRRAELVDETGLRQKLATDIADLRQRFGDLPAEEIQALVEEAIQSSRQFPGT